MPLSRSPFRRAEPARGFLFQAGPRRRFTALDRVSGALVTIWAPEPGFPATDPRGRVRVEVDGQRVEYPARRPNTVAAAWAFAVATARTGRDLDRLPELRQVQLHIAEIAARHGVDVRFPARA